jgi:hypothetical protein
VTAESARADYHQGLGGVLSQQLADRGDAFRGADLTADDRAERLDAYGRIADDRHVLSLAAGEEREVG